MSSCLFTCVRLTLLLVFVYLQVVKAQAGGKADHDGDRRQGVDSSRMRSSLRKSRKWRRTSS